jgi:hypothetical protein
LATFSSIGRGFISLKPLIDEQCAGLDERFTRSMDEKREPEELRGESHGKKVANDRQRCTRSHCGNRESCASTEPEQCDCRGAPRNKPRKPSDLPDRGTAEEDSQEELGERCKAKSACGYHPTERIGTGDAEAKQQPEDAG